MMEGTFRPDYRPVIRVTVWWNDKVQDIVALIDTGFSGELKVSPSVSSELGLVVTHTQGVLLGNDTGIETPAALVYILMEGTMEEVSVLITPGTGAIGTGLLKRFGYKLIVDFKNSKVQLEKC